MLVKVIDHKGKACWVNPAYVRGLLEKGRMTGIDVSGWPGQVKVDVPMDEVAGLLNIAMESSDLNGAMISEQAARSEEALAQQQAAMAAVIVIG
ncbi:MAG: hypothetical protein H6810_06670 [Phycisphaeraceae bacterium]|nr:MAG: hypothetical protein H6810_06670 [Phycisphaeraceae bacterium]